MGETREQRQRRNQLRATVARAQGAEADLFGERGEVVEPEKRGPGRPAGAKNKGKQKIAELMSARGFRDPVEQLAYLAGLDRSDLHPLAHAALVAEATGEDLTKVIAEMRHAATALLPYYHGKVTPDVNVNAAQMTVHMAAPTGGGGAMRTVGPPPMPIKPTEEQRKDFIANQQVSESDNSEGDAE